MADDSRAFDVRRLLGAGAAGAISGSSTDLAFLPFDTLRARLNYGQLTSATSANPLTAMRQVGAEMIAADGVASLFRGSSSVALFSAPTFGIYFGTYKAVALQLERRFGGPEHTPSWAYLGAGLNAELFALGLFLPYDVTKQRLQCAPLGSRDTVFSVLRHVLAASGPAGLYRGATAAMATYVPFSGLYFCSYERFKRALVGQARANDAQAAAAPSSAPAVPAAHFLSAVAAATVAAVATQPLDCLKTRIQVGDLAGGRAAERTLLGTLRAALAHGGVSSLMRGTLARVLAIAPGCGCSMTVFEMVLPHITALLHSPAL
ncbi:hypothetical protein KFE25_003090 [Diacronema lutheri]|uniref:Mitochondrial carrier protein n=2 Tax=Diacronema lutheri TaxID=2081491 RepID=A0A8J6C5Y4_DIALT|nr:hypothetical protein KFE25_003090 [Diacronema lutheri]